MSRQTEVGGVSTSILQLHPQAPLVFSKDPPGSGGLHCCFGWSSSRHQTGDPTGPVSLVKLPSSIQADLEGPQRCRLQRK